MSDILQGTVTMIASVACRVDVDGVAYSCVARRKLTEGDIEESKPLTVGDVVEFEVTAEGEGVVTAVMPRRTKLSRALSRDARREHVIASNVDQLVIVASVRQPDLNPRMIDRYIIAGDAGGLDVLICINKVDLARGPDDYESVAAMYREMDFAVLTCSAQTGEGIDELRAALKGKTSVLAGHSGVGKSSLINAVQPGMKLKTGRPRRKGAHVTTNVSLLRLDGGGYVVDTPGVREMSLWDIEKGHVAQFFPVIWELSHDCHMPDCTHMHEPDCAVQQAVERGDIARDRYESYVSIVESIDGWQPPRETDVDRPTEQVAKSKRRASRRVQRQRLQQSWEEEDVEGEDGL